MAFNYTAFSVTLVGLIVSFFVVSLNLRLLIKYSKRLLRNKHDYELFTIRFVVDILYSIAISVYDVALILSYVLEFILFEKKPVIAIGLTFSNIYTARFLLAFFISAERLTAVFFPIKFHVHRQRFSPMLFATALVLYGLFEDVMYFFVCEVDPTVKGCSIYACTFNQCFLSYWTGNKMIIGAFSCSVSLTLFIKIVFLNRHKLQSDLRKTVYLCLVDGLMTMLFDFCPFFFTLIFRDNLLSADKFGPYNSTIKSCACLIDVIIATVILKPKQKSVVLGMQQTSRYTGTNSETQHHRI